MNIKPIEVTIRELYDGYENNAEEGVIGFHGRLNIRPAYQREYVYEGKQRDEVVRTVRRGYPLNVMYWSKSGINGKGEDMYELLDGQQRTISICDYVDWAYSIDNGIAFHNLTSEEQEEILNYKLMIYVCEGTEREKLEWFKIINIAGLKLSDQELRNAIYTGTWLSDAKTYFSKVRCPAWEISKQYVNATVNRQELLEKALKWIIDYKGIDSIEVYMSLHQHDSNADELKTYFKNVIDWVKQTFPVYRRNEMLKVDWGYLYNRYKDALLDANELEKEISKLMADYDVTKKDGIYTYVLTRVERYLSIRSFDERTKRTVYEQQKGICLACGEHFSYEKMQADHIVPWSKGGRTVIENCQMLCVQCNKDKSSSV